MVRLTVVAALVGLAIGITLSTYAHSGNGFETGPLVVLALALSILGTLVSGVLMLVGKRGHHVAAAGAFSLAMLVSLTILPLVWPYPASPTPRPLEDRPGSAQPK